MINSFKVRSNGLSIIPITPEVALLFLLCSYCCLKWTLFKIKVSEPVSMIKLPFFPNNSASTTIKWSINLKGIRAVFLLIISAFGNTIVLMVLACAVTHPKKTKQSKINGFIWWLLEFLLLRLLKMRDVTTLYGFYEINL